MTNKATQIIQEWLCTNESHGYIDSGSGKRIVHCYMEGLIELFDKREQEIQAMIDEMVGEGLVHTEYCEGLPCDCVAKESKREIINIAKKYI